MARRASFRERLPRTLRPSRPPMRSFLIGHHRNSWALARYGLVTALLAWALAIALYPGGTVLDPSSHGYSFTHSFLSDLGNTVSFSSARNTPGALLFGAGILIGVCVLAGLFVGAVRALSAEVRGRPFARLAACAAVLVCAGFVGVALTPEDLAFGLHRLSGTLAFRSFPVATALLGIATMRDARFRSRAVVGWASLTIVLVGFIIMTHVGPVVGTEHGLMAQVITQKVVVATVLVVLWLESLEIERAIPAGADATAPSGPLSP